MLSEQFCKPIFIITFKISGEASIKQEFNTFQILQEIKSDCTNKKIMEKKQPNLKKLVNSMSILNQQRRKFLSINFKTQNFLLSEQFYKTIFIITLMISGEASIKQEFQTLLSIFYTHTSIQHFSNVTKFKKARYVHINSEPEETKSFKY